MACRMPIRRRVLWWGSMLLLAAAINWIVAWACVLWSPRHDWRVWISASPDNDRLDAVAAWFRLDRADDPAIWTKDANWYRDVDIQRESGFGVLVTRMSLDKQWRMRAGSGLTKLARITIVECGWPGLGLRAEHVFINPDPQRFYPEENARWPSGVPDSASNWRHALHMPESLGGQETTPMGGVPWFPLPFAIRPLGFTASTLFWLAVLAAPGIAFRAARRALRRRRGRCAGCGYDIRGLGTCPECGEAPFPPRSATAAA